MKNLLIYINPRKDFDDEGKIAVKIQIDNSLDLGWARKDILLVTNFPYEYNGVNSLVVGDDNYCTHWPWSTKTYTVGTLFEQNYFEEGEVYWAHDMDVFQNEVITESQVESEIGDIGLTDRGISPKWAMGSIFFKSSAKDIFKWTKDIMDKFKIDEETAIWILTGHNGRLDGEKTKLVNAYLQTHSPEIKNFNTRIKKMNIRYNFIDWDLPLCFDIAIKPIKLVHFHLNIDLNLDSYMYGKNGLNKVLMSERLIEIFHKHGVKGVTFKKMKNLMIYINPEKKFTGQAEDLVKKQIDNSLKLGWKEEDIVLVTNFPFQYQGVKAMILEDSVFDNTNDKVYKSHVIFQLLTQEVVKDAEFWWYHDLNVFQTRQIESPEIDLEDTTAGFMLDSSGKLDTSSFFFRKASHKLFEWMRNRTIRLNSDEKTGLMSLTKPNYRNIDSLYKRLNIENFSKIIPLKELDKMEFQNAIKQKKKGIIDKWDHFSPIYDFHLQKFHNQVDQPLNLLEIGIDRGGSLFTWQEYFPTATITGIDIKPDCKQYEEGNIKVFIGDQANVAFLNSVNEKAGPFDIIVDDGGHTMNQQITAFNTLFPLLKDGGIYIIEDIHTSYWPRYFDGEEKTIDVLKKLIDGLNFWALEKIDIVEDGKAKVVTINRKRSYFDENILSIHFYNALVIIEKGKNQKGRVTNV